jgi:hypothetical protein
MGSRRRWVEGEKIPGQNMFADGGRSIWLSFASTLSAKLSPDQELNT